MFYRYTKILYKRSWRGEICLRTSSQNIYCADLCKSTLCQMTDISNICFVGRHGALALVFRSHRFFYIIHVKCFMLSSTHQRGKFRHSHRNATQTACHSSCRSRSCQPWSRIACRPATRDTCCTGSTLHASAFPCRRGPIIGIYTYIYIIILN